MYYKVCFLDKHFPTFRTLIEFLPSLNSLSFIKCLLLVEGSSTLIGLKKFLCRLSIIEIRMEA